MSIFLLFLLILPIKILIIFLNTFKNIIFDIIILFLSFVIIIPLNIIFTILLLLIKIKELFILINNNIINTYY